MKLMHGTMALGHGHFSHRVCTEDGKELPMTEANVERLVNSWNESATPAGPGEVERLRKENDTMRKLIAESSMDCIYCGLSKEDMGKCELGFPGCGRADDMLI